MFFPKSCKKQCEDAYKQGWKLSQFYARSAFWTYAWKMKSQRVCPAYLSNIKGWANAISSSLMEMRWTVWLALKVTKLKKFKTYDRQSLKRAQSHSSIYQGLEGGRQELGVDNVFLRHGTDLEPATQTAEHFSKEPCVFTRRIKNCSLKKKITWENK